MIRNTNFADIVHRRGQFDDVAFVLGQPHAFGDQSGILRHADDMVAGDLVTVLATLGQPQQGLVFPHTNGSDRLADLLFQPARAVTDNAMLFVLSKQIAAAHPALDMVDGADQ